MFESRRAYTYSNFFIRYTPEESIPHLLWPVATLGLTPFLWAVTAAEAWLKKEARVIRGLNMKKTYGGLTVSLCLSV